MDKEAGKCTEIWERTSPTHNTRSPWTQHPWKTTRTVPSALSVASWLWSDNFQDHKRCWQLTEKSTGENNSCWKRSLTITITRGVPQEVLLNTKQLPFRILCSHCKKEKERDAIYFSQIYTKIILKQERTYLCNIPKVSSSGNISNYICPAAEKLHVKQNSTIGKNRLNILKHVYKLEMYSAIFSSIAR